MKKIGVRGISVKGQAGASAYSLTAENSGFASIVKPNLDLHVADNIVVNFELHIGAVGQTVTVAGGGPLVNTTRR